MGGYRIGQQEISGYAGHVMSWAVPFWTFRFPAVSSALDASFGRSLSTTEAAILSGASVTSSSSGILSVGDSDMMQAVWGLVLIRK